MATTPLRSIQSFLVQVKPKKAQGEGALLGSARHKIISPRTEPPKTYSELSEPCLLWNRLIDDIHLSASGWEAPRGNESITEDVKSPRPKSPRTPRDKVKSKEEKQRERDQETLDLSNRSLSAMPPVPDGVKKLNLSQNSLIV